MTSQIIVLIPAYNEEKHLRKLLTEIQEHITDIVVINDGSHDRTCEIAEQSGVHLLQHPKNLGKGVALRTGFQYILEKEYDGCVVLDGDAQHSPQDLPTFLKVAQDPRVGVVIGNRMDDATSMPLIRRWTNWIMSSILSKCIGQSVPDTQCGYRYIRSDVLKVIDLSSKRYAIDSEILIEANRHGFQITSVPIRTIYRNQKSGIQPFRDTYYFFKLLFEKRQCFGKKR